MAWLKVDDGFWSHPKTLALSNDAVALWVRSGAWSCQQLTDGFIPDHALPMFGISDAAALELAQVGYWERDDETRGYSFHDWDEYQEASEHVKARREAARERMRTVRANRERTKGERSQGVRDVFEGSSPNPDPTRPDPTRPTSTDVEVPEEKPRKRGSRIPEPFIVNREMRSWAAERVPGVDVDGATEKFVNYWRAKTRDATKLDWRATWDNWLISDYERQQQRGGKPTPEQRARTTLALATDLLDDPKGITA